ncbi:polysaccharide deacetylase family protein [Halococcus thailandensis]|uniref:Putative polysaccharide deacetylase n=1 Tax=Halococcus thailandensis JCM 13552 TaxID=1227457 RepID=M0NF58_9EURY|nr:polysaccharide deacetylase family protein [Halococcus thailandensis]EMA56188.1 putative polysaccharide deacetylase [Halococcus thailandensis JCM 13552]
MTTNVLSFDLEHWYSATLLRDRVADPATHVEGSVAIVLDTLAAYDVRATFFVVGELAREHPSLVARIADAGHEVASHGHTHRPLFELDRETFAAELDRSTRAIHDATGTAPTGFRAPNFSVTRRTPWAIGMLKAAGYRYDSSVFPVRTPMYGVSGAPVEPYHPASDAPFEAQVGQGDLVELPLAVAHPRYRLPVAGGFYARTLPTWLLERGIATLNARGIPATIYFHPWEFNPAVARAVSAAGASRYERFVSAHGIRRLQEKLETLLDEFVFGAASDVAREYVNKTGASDATRPPVGRGR